jgi:hypothetical protein
MKRRAPKPKKPEPPRITTRSFRALMDHHPAKILSDRQERMLNYPDYDLLRCLYYIHQDNAFELGFIDKFKAKPNP